MPLIVLIYSVEDKKEEAGGRFWKGQRSWSQT